MIKLANRLSPLKCFCRVGGKDQKLSVREGDTKDPLWKQFKEEANTYKQLSDCLCFTGKKPKKGTKVRPAVIYYKKRTAQRRKKK